MFKVRVERVLAKDIDSVFEIITDHEGYATFAGIKKAVVHEEGSEEKNGKGALREINFGGITFFERITEFERPTKMCYQIESSKPVTIQHEKGEITLTPEGENTRVVWISEGTIRIPILGPLLLDKLAQKQATEGFDGMLKLVEKR